MLQVKASPNLQWKKKTNNEKYIKNKKQHANCRKIYSKKQKKKIEKRKTNYEHFSPEKPKRLILKSKANTKKKPKIKKNAKKKKNNQHSFKVCTINNETKQKKEEIYIYM